MNEFRTTIDRRRFMQRVGATSAAVVTTGFLVLRKKDASSSDQPESVAEIQPPSPAADSPEEFSEIITEETSNYLRLTKPHEEEYAHFIAKLGLRYIAPHELIRAHRNSRNGIANILPSPELWENMVPTLLAADELRHRLNRKLLRITSAYRSPEYNRQCPGAASQSWHTKNCALDLVYNCSPREVMNEARKMRTEKFFTGGLGRYSTFLHLDTRGRDATWVKG